MPTSISIPAQGISTTFTPTSSIAATNVQSAIAELAAETVDLSSNQTIGGVKSFSGGAINLTNSVSNIINYGSNGFALPSINTRSIGAKQVLYSTLSSTFTDYAIGVASGVLWQSVPQNTNAFKFSWYGGTTEVASLSGDGLLGLQKLTVAVVNSWITPTLLNTWNNFGLGHATAAYRKLPDGTIEFKGLIRKPTTPALDEIIFTLPAGFRPLERRIFSTVSNALVARVDVLNNGDVVLNQGSNDWLSLQTIRFVAEQ